MSETPAETPPETPAQGQEPPETTDWKAEARKWEQRAKDNSAAAKEAEKARLAAMTESERAIEEAKQAARREAAIDYGKRLVRSEFDALAGRRNPDYDTAQALEYVDLTRFLDEAGEPDPKAIKAAVERLVPEASGRPPGYDGGARMPAKAPGDMNSVIRRAAGYAG